MSKTTPLDGSIIDYTILKRAVKEDFVTQLSQISGEKCIILDMSLSKAINTLLDGAAVFKMNNVTTFTRLSGESITTEATIILFIIKETAENWKNVVRITKELQNERDGRSYSFHVFVVPQLSLRYSKYLQDQEVDTILKIHDLEMNMVPIDNDVISMENTTCFSDLYLHKNESILSQVAMVIMKLQVLFGAIPRMDFFGGKGQSTRKILEQCQPIAVNENSVIDRLVVLDRAVDYSSLLVTPLTYEALIAECLPFENGCVTIDGGEIGRNANTVANVVLNSNDSLFASIADSNISIVPRYLKESSIEIQQMYKSRPKDSECSLSELTSFAKKVGTIQEMYESMQIQLGITSVITKTTNSDSFREKWQRERQLLEGENCLENIRSLMTEKSMEEVLHYLCLYSTVNNGIKTKELDSIRRDFLYTYGFQYLPLLYNLEQTELLMNRTVGNKYSSIKAKLHLIQSDCNGTVMDDMNYVTSGYAPIAPRLLQMLLNGDSSLSDVCKLLNIEYSSLQQKESSANKDQTIAVFFVGGITYLEIAAIHYIQRKNPGLHILILTTCLYKSSEILTKLIDESTAPLVV